MPAPITLPDRRARMTPGRKALIVEALRRGMLTHTRACELYDLSLEELNGWLERASTHGTRGLAVTKLQEFSR